MAERKVQSKHIPADYDHRVLAALKKSEPKKRKKSKNEPEKKESVRIMLPFNVCCASCNSYMYRGRKFNGKKEEGLDPNYLGTKVLRFHIKCETCSAPIVFRTDPKSSGFVMVSGARESKTTAGTFNPLADVVEKDDDNKAEDGLDPVQALEKRALETKRELEVLNELEREMARSKARMAIAQGTSSSSVLNSSSSAGVRKNGEETSDNDDEEQDKEALAAFRERKRQMDFQQSSSQSTSGFGIGMNDERDVVIQGTIKRVMKKAKPAVTTMTSLVPYADDDDEV